jgi:Mlc titration factor MtfA (ptsG expression regulator)
MFDSLRKWRRDRVLKSAAIPETLWLQALEALPFLAIYTEAELARLRELVILFLDDKSIVGAGGHEVTPVQRVIVALQACALVLNIGLDHYEGFENIVIYPSEFVRGGQWEDESGVIHKDDEPMAGEAMPGGPVVLSWPDVEASADFDQSGMNLAIHEFAHKIDMRSGDANGCPPLPPEIPPDEWKKTLTAAYEDFHARVERDDRTAIDPYAAESPGEFFAVLSEVFFADPKLLRFEYPEVYRQLATFYRQDPAARSELLRDDVI